MREQSSSSRRQRSATPPELKIDRDEPDWDYSYDVASRDDWDYSFNADNSIDRDANALVPPSQASRSSHGCKVAGHKSRRSSIRNDKALLDQINMPNVCAKPACATEQPEEHSLFFQTFPDSMERSIKRPESIHQRTERAAPGAVIARKAQKSDKKNGHEKVDLPSEIPEDSSWSSFETAGAASVMDSASFVTSGTSLSQPGCAFAFPFLSSAPHKKDDCSQASPTSVTDIVGDLEELQDQLEALRATSPQQTGGCQWSPSTTSTFSRSTSASALLPVNKVANFSRKRMEQLDAFIMAKSSGRDSPEALRLAYSASLNSPEAFRKACLEKSEPPVEEEKDECPDTSRDFSFNSLHTSCLEKPEPPVEEEKDECPDTSTAYSLASLHTFETIQDRGSPATVSPPPPPRKAPCKAVRFATELVTHVTHRPTTLPEENKQLYFSKQELQELERDRMDQIYEEQFEIIQKRGNEVAVAFPVRRCGFPPELTETSSSWDSEDGVFEI